MHLSLSTNVLNVNTSNLMIKFKQKNIYTGSMFIEGQNLCPKCISERKKNFREGIEHLSNEQCICRGWLCHKQNLADKAKGIRNCKLQMSTS